MPALEVIKGSTKKGRLAFFATCPEGIVLLLLLLHPHLYPRYHLAFSNQTWNSLCSTQQQILSNSSSFKGQMQLNGTDKHPNLRIARLCQKILLYGPVLYPIHPVKALFIYQLQMHVQILSIVWLSDKTLPWAFSNPAKSVFVRLPRPQFPGF